MAFDIKDIPLIRQWIEQFDLVDKYAAELLLQSLKFVSFSEFESSIQVQVESIVNKVQIKDKACVAIFPVSKNLTNKFNQEKERKQENDSSGRIAHTLKNLERKLGSKVEVSPRIKSMANKKVRHIIYVDDFIGSGQRIIDFWQDDVSKSVKSWVSGGYCQVWLVCYTAHAQGVERIVKKLNAFEEATIRTTIGPLGKSSIIQSERLKELVVKYGARTSKPNVSLGYGANCTPIIFQHGCPNNAPAILWVNGKPNKRTNSISEDRWDALFSERSIDTSLYPLFDKNITFQSYPELLWSAGQFRLAIEFLESENEEAKLHNLILALASKKYTRRRISEILIPIGDESEVAINTLTKHGLIDEDMNLSIFGRDVLERNRRKKNEFVDKDYEDYYPSTYLGLLRDI